MIILVRTVKIGQTRENKTEQTTLEGCEHKTKHHQMLAGGYMYHS